MDDRERIEAMAAEGRITRDEADRLLGVLDDIDSAEQQLQGAEGQGGSDPLPPAQNTPAAEGDGSDSGRAPTASAPQRPAEPSPTPAPGESQPAPRTAESAPPPPAAAGARRPATRPGDISWLEVNLLAGDINIEVDDTADSPSAVASGAGQIELERIDDGYRLGGFSQKGENFIDRLLGNFTRGDTRVTLPSGWGLRLNMKAGDLTISGPLRYLAGSLLAGDLDAAEVHGVDLSVSAGDIDLGLLLREGQHRLHAVAGDLNVRLLSGSDAKLRGRVNIGDLSVPESWSLRSKGLGSSFEHTLGQGRAELNLDLGTGDLDVLVERSRSAATDG